MVTFCLLLVMNSPYLVKLQQLTPAQGGQVRRADGRPCPPAARLYLGTLRSKRLREH